MLNSHKKIYLNLFILISFLFFSKFIVPNHIANNFLVYLITIIFMVVIPFVIFSTIHYFRLINNKIKTIILYHTDYYAETTYLFSCIIWLVILIFLPVHKQMYHLGNLSIFLGIIFGAIFSLVLNIKYMKKLDDFMLSSVEVLGYIDKDSKINSDNKEIIDFLYTIHFHIKESSKPDIISVLSRKTTIDKFDLSNAIYYRIRPEDKILKDTKTFQLSNESKASKQNTRKLETKEESATRISYDDSMDTSLPEYVNKSVYLIDKVYGELKDLELSQEHLKALYDLRRLVTSQKDTTKFSTQINVCLPNIEELIQSMEGLPEPRFEIELIKDYLDLLKSENDTYLTDYETKVRDLHKSIIEKAKKK